MGVIRFGLLFVEREHAGGGIVASLVELTFGTRLQEVPPLQRPQHDGLHGFHRQGLQYQCYT